jgi:hypothetical protein
VDRVDGMIFEKLQDARVILGSTRAQSEGDQVFGPHYPRTRPVDISWDGFAQGFFLQALANRQKLYGPSLNDDVLALNLAPSSRKVIIYWRQSEK